MPMVQVTPVIGLPQYNGWSQVITNSSHSLVCALAIEGANAGNIGRDLANQLSESQPVSPADFHTLLTTLFIQARAQGAEVHIAACYLTVAGCVLAARKAEIILRRGFKVGAVIQAEAELKLVEGKFHPEDVLVLVTEQATRFSGEVHQKLTRGFDVDTIITSMVPAVHGLSDSALSSLAFITMVGQSPNGAATDTLVAMTLKEPLKPRPPLTVVASPRLLPPSPILPAKAKWRLPHFSPLNLSRSLASRLSLKWRKSAAVMVPGSDQYVDRPSSKRWLIQLAVVVLLIAATASAGWWWRQQTQLQVQEVNAAMQPWNQQLQTAQTLVETDPVQARLQYESVVAGLTALQSEFQNKKASLTQLEKRLEEVKQAAPTFSGQAKVDELPTFYDLRLVASDFIATDADALENKAFFFDQGNFRLLQLDLLSKQYQEKVFSDLQVTDLQATTIGALFLTPTNGINRLVLGETVGDLEIIIPDNEQVKESKLIAHFGQSVYVISSSRRAIYRFTAGSDNKYGGPVSWVKSGQNVAFDQVQSWTIDGDIWLGLKDGGITKLSSGRVEPFTVAGLTTAFNSPLVIKTHEDLPYLYVLEPAQKRIVLLNKEGQLIREITSQNLASATNLVINQELGKILAVSGSLVFEVPL